MTIIKQAAVAMGFDWSPEVASYSTRIVSESNRLQQLSSRLRETTHANAYLEEDTVPGSSDRPTARQDQRMLWIDGVGGYLVVMAEELTLGQASGYPGDGITGPDVPLLADLSRRHLKITRKSGGYIATPHGPTRLNGQLIDSPTALQDAALLTLGDSVQLRFRRPHALSATARIEMESSHRSVPNADAILLMAESCVLGPKSHSHIRCRNWKSEAILFRGAEGLLCRTGGDLLVDGVRTNEPAVIRAGNRVEGQDFALSVEQVNEE